MHVSEERLVKDLAELGKIGAKEELGRTRLALTPEDFEARRFLITRMKQAGLQVRVDEVVHAGNSIAFGDQRLDRESGVSEAVQEGPMAAR